MIALGEKPPSTILCLLGVTGGSRQFGFCPRSTTTCEINVPTIVVFNEGEEQERFQANIMMTMDATIEEVQEAVDDIMLNDF